MTPEEFIKLNVIDGHPSCFRCNMVTEEDALKAVEMARKEQRSQGWICPKCGRVYSPNISMCSYCYNKNTSKRNTDNLDHISKNFNQSLGGLSKMSKTQQPINDKMQ